MKMNLQHISDETVQRYTNRYKKLGYHIKTLGWGTKEQQDYRFSKTLDEAIDFSGKSILDIGCGFGDYFNFLKSNNINFSHYIGYDINENLVNEAKKLYASKKSTFNVTNILKTNEKNIADIGVMLGLLNFNLKDKFDNYEYSKKMILKAFSLVNEVLIVDFLSTKLIDNYPKEDFVFYHNPSKMIDFAFILSNNVILKHNYAPIPQKEFMLFIFKDSTIENI
ncbi:MAG: class I SAM-dependent methyltransferase [Epsilonproteobacteria bacterium]|nr:class I SAM-dependent methyltransferase [Campylobacterota bacterium]